LLALSKYLDEKQLTDEEAEVRFKDYSQSVILSMAEDILEFEEINWDRLFFYFDYDTYLELYYEDVDDVITEEDLENMTEEELKEYYDSLDDDEEKLCDGVGADGEDTENPEGSSGLEDFEVDDWDCPDQEEEEEEEEEEEVDNGVDEWEFYRIFMTLNSVSEEIMEAIFEYILKDDSGPLMDMIDSEEISEDQANQWVPEV